MDCSRYCIYKHGKNKRAFQFMGLWMQRDPNWPGYFRISQLNPSLVLYWPTWVNIETFYLNTVTYFLLAHLTCKNRGHFAFLCFCCSTKSCTQVTLVSAKTRTALKVTILFGCTAVWWEGTVKHWFFCDFGEIFQWLKEGNVVTVSVILKYQQQDLFKKYNRVHCHVNFYIIFVT
jgi:hypothetical protein